MDRKIKGNMYLSDNYFYKKNVETQQKKFVCSISEIILFHLLFMFAKINVICSFLCRVGVTNCSLF